MPFLVRELLDAGLLHEDVYTVMGKGLRLYTQEPYLDGATLKWRPAVAESRDLTVPCTRPCALYARRRLKSVVRQFG